jgi:peptidoglycan LD-endopeptidase LytH
VLVTSRNRLSNGEAFTEGYRELGLGTVVGKPTAGWIIVTASNGLVDGTSVRMPGPFIRDDRGQNMDMNPRAVAARAPAVRLLPVRLLVVLVLPLVAACPRPDVDAGGAAADILADSATAPADAAAVPAAAARPPVSPVPGISAAPGAVLRAEADELAALSAALVVPVAGVERWQLQDTYTEARGAGRTHDAIDIMAPRGTPVLSAADGRLLRLFDSRPGGLMVYATDPTERFILLYGHLDGYAPGLRDGMPLRRGQVIGYVGTTGNAPPDAPHLHFGILRGDPAVSWFEGVAVNPYPLLVPGGSSR